MDPDCAICSHPAMAQCECEATALDKAVSQAETRMMASVFTEIRSWVRAHAQDYILEYFSMLTKRRKALHAQKISHINDRAYHYYRAPPHPSEIMAADDELKRAIDDDWKASVQRYPEVLEYFYGLVDLSLPSDDEPRVSDPPLSALGGGKMGRRRSIGRGAGGRRVRVVEEESMSRVGRAGRRAVQFAPAPGSGYGYVQPGFG